MWKCVTWIFLSYIAVFGMSKLVTKMSCYQYDPEPIDLEPEIKGMLRPSAFMNLVEEFTKLEGIIRKRAVEKIRTNEDLTLYEFIKLGFFRKSTKFYLVISMIYLYWLSYLYYSFRNDEYKFSVMIAPYRGFYWKTIILLVYFVFICLIAYTSSNTVSWIQHYYKANRERESKVELFWEEFDKAANYSSSRMACYMAELMSEIDEVEAFHNRLERYLYKKIPSIDRILVSMSDIVNHLLDNCNITTSFCGIGRGKIKVENWTGISYFNNSYSMPQHSDFVWNGLSEKFQQIKKGVISQRKSNFNMMRSAVHQRLVLVKDGYKKVDRLFKFPGSFYIAGSYYFILAGIIGIVFFSCISFLSFLFGRKYFENSGTISTLVTFLKKINIFFLIVSLLLFLWFYLIILFNSAGNSLYFNVFRDSQREVFGNVNITDSNNHTFSLGLFLNSIDNSFLENLLGLNPRSILKQNNESWNQFLNWKKQISAQINLDFQFYQPISDFCENVMQIFQGKNRIYDQNGELNLLEMIQYCQRAEMGQVSLSGFNDDLEKTVKIVKYIRIENLNVANRTGNDLEDFRFLHEKYRLLTWNDIVAPVAFLEAPSIILLICMYVLNFMLMVSISMLEFEGPDDSYEDRYEYYKYHTADRGLFWFSM